MAAETGSGKTGAFCVPILQIVHETLRDLRDGKKSKVSINFVIKFHVFTKKISSSIYRVIHHNQ